MHRVHFGKESLTTYLIYMKGLLVAHDYRPFHINAFEHLFNEVCKENNLSMGTWSTLCDTINLS